MNAQVIAGEAPVRITPLSAHIGAEIGSVDLARPLTQAQIDAIRAALLKWRVVFFREQFLSHE